MLNKPVIFLQKHKGSNPFCGYNFVTTEGVCCNTNCLVIQESQFGELCGLGEMAVFTCGTCGVLVTATHYQEFTT